MSDTPVVFLIFRPIVSTVVECPTVPDLGWGHVKVKCIIGYSGPDSGIGQVIIIRISIINVYICILNLYIYSLVNHDDRVRERNLPTTRQG